MDCRAKTCRVGAFWTGRQRASKIVTPIDERGEAPAHVEGAAHVDGPHAVVLLAVRGHAPCLQRSSSSSVPMSHPRSVLAAGLWCDDGASALEGSARAGTDSMAPSRQPASPRGRALPETPVMCARPHALPNQTATRAASDPMQTLPCESPSSHRSVVDEAAETAREVTLDRRCRGLNARPVGDVQHQGGHTLGASRLLAQPRGSLVGCCERVHASPGLADIPTNSLAWSDIICL